MIAMAVRRRSGYRALIFLEYPMHPVGGIPSHLLPYL